VTREEAIVRERLTLLAQDERGRRLLQLALRGLQESGRGLTIGCWVKRDGGVAGCLFQHAYWQGMVEGVFEPTALTSTAIKEYVGAEDFALVVSAIRAFDALGRRRFVRWRRGRFGIPWRRLDEERWRSTVEGALVDALATTAERGRAAHAPART
jgi:hypothetical protein